MTSFLVVRLSLIVDWGPLESTRQVQIGHSTGVNFEMFARETDVFYAINYNHTTLFVCEISLKV